MTELTPKQYVAQRQAGLIQTITALRERHGLSQQDLANLLGCSRSRIARLELDGHGEYGLGELELLAVRFGQEPAQFLSLSAPDRRRLEQAYASQVTAPVQGQSLTCALPPGGSLEPIGLALAWSPDGAFLAGAVPDAGGEKDLLCLWAAASGELIRTIRTEGSISTLVFHPAGHLIATATDMDTIELWAWQKQEAVACLDPVDGSSYDEELWELVGESGYGVISQVQFSPDGAILAAVNEDHGTLRLWQTATGREIRTLCLPDLFAELDRERSQLELGSSWQIVPAAEAEPPSRYGEFAVRQLAFTPDGQLLAVLPHLSRRLELFSLTGQHLRGEIFARSINCLDLVGLDQSGERWLVACGGEGQLLEVWYQGARQDVTQRELIQTTMADAPVDATIRDLKILDANCVLGLVHNRERAWKIVNLVSQQPLPLPAVHPWSLAVCLAPGGQAVAYPDPTGQLKIQPVQPAALIQSEAALRLHLARRQQTTPAHLASLFERAETEAAGPENIGLGPEPPDESLAAEEPELALAGLAADWLKRIQSARAQGEAYGLAILSPEDTTTVEGWVETLTAPSDRVWWIDLPQPGPRIKTRALLAYLTQRSLKRGESTESVIAELEGQPGEVMLIDHAEKLHHQTLLALGSRLQRIAGVVLLIVRNPDTFMAEAEKIRTGLDWFLSRAIWSPDLAPLSQPGPAQAAALEAEESEGRGSKESRLEFGLDRLKTATPRAQGGYGLAMLRPEDTTTVHRFVEQVRQQTTDRIGLAPLPRQGARIKRRQLVETIVGRSLRRGESTDGVIRDQIQGHYNLIVIDHAERLHPATLLWICDNLRSIVEAFVLVVRDEAAFMKMVDQTVDPAWTLGRSIPIDLGQWLSED